MNERDTIDACLAHCRTIAVVGLSPKTHRNSFRVSQYMQARGYRIVPINPNASEILGERVYATLSEAAQHERIDMVNCFRNANDIAPIAQERRSERRLIADYRATVTALLGKLSANNHAQALELARLPDGIKGFGHVKARHLEAVQAKWDALLAQWKA